jgi:signal transduction histidine kinase
MTVAPGVNPSHAAELDALKATCVSLRARQDDVEALSAAALEFDFQALLDRAVAVVACRLEVDAACVLELLPGRAALAVRAAVGFSSLSDAPETMPGGSATLAGYTASLGDTVVVADFNAETRFGISKLLADEGVRSGISVPIGAAPWGVLQVLTKEVQGFEQDDVSMLRAVAAVLVLAAAHEASDTAARRLGVQRRRLIHAALEATEIERRRVADLLHDEILQHLMFAQHELEETPERIRDPAIQRVAISVGKVIGLLRMAIGDLHPVVLLHTSLSARLEELSLGFTETRALKITTRVAIDAPTRHDSLVTFAIRELLANVVKHGRATVANVLVTANGHLLVEVGDNGVGLDAASIAKAVTAGHIGLASLVERVEASDGSVEFTTAPDGTGTVVRLSLPLP